MQLEVLAEYNHEHKYMDVWAGFAGSEFEGKVVKAIQRLNEKEDVTVGLRADKSPAYILIRNAENLGRPFYEAAARISMGEEPDKKDIEAISKRCLALMREMAMAYQKKSLRETLNPKEVETTFQFSCAS